MLAPISSSAACGPAASPSNHPPEATRGARHERAPLPRGNELERALERHIRGAVIHALNLHGERRPAELIDDLVQETWCRLLERSDLDRFRGADEDATCGYLRRIAVNVVVDGYRARSARKRGAARSEDFVTAKAELERRHDPSQSPERQLLAREELVLFLRGCRTAIGAERSPERWRMARWGLLEGRSTHEIARRLGHRLSAVAIDAYLSRARRRLEEHGIRLPLRARGRFRFSSPCDPVAAPAEALCS